MNAPLEQAKLLYNGGLSVIPIKADGSKCPDLPSWRRHMKVRMSKQEIVRSFPWDEEMNPVPMGVGIICGAVSGGLEVIDFDLGHLFYPWSLSISPELYAKLTVVKTPRPGFHVYYRCSVIGRASRIAVDKSKSKEDRPKALIETRGEGSLVVTIGSHPSAHNSKRLYEHFDGPGLEDIQYVTPEERVEIWEAARGFDLNDTIRKQIDRERQRLKRSENPYTGSDTELRFNDAKTWSEVLIPYGWTPTYDDDEYWTRPGKDEGISARVVEATDGTEILVVFSSNTSPLVTDVGLAKFNKFQAYKMLAHNGDHRAACEHLESQESLI